jgi:hypothetical protein
MNKLEKGNESKSKLDILEDLESKIMNLQSQLRNVREQREKGRILLTHYYESINGVGH